MRQYAPGPLRQDRSVPFILPDGTRCNRDHLEKYCWYKDPAQARDQRIRELIEKKLGGMRTLSQAALQTTTALPDGDRLYEIAALCAQTLHRPARRTNPWTHDRTASNNKATRRRSTSSHAARRQSTYNRTSLTT